jgi:hypothetical protein
MHTDLTLAVMDDVTVVLGEQLRSFQSKTCPAFHTRELQREMNARIRHQATRVTTRNNNSKAKSRASQPGTPVDPSTSETSETATPAADLTTARGTLDNYTACSQPEPTGRHPKTLNLNTYKIHAFGDYVSTIKAYGTTDSYSTEAVCLRHSPIHVDLLTVYQSELHHRTPKSRYTRTSRKSFVKQLAQIERRQARIRRLCEKLLKSGTLASETVPCISDEPYNIGKSQNHPVNVTQLLRKHAEDPAIKVGCTTV